MIHRIPSTDKVTAAVGWVPERDLESILADVFAHERSLVGGGTVV